MKGKTASEILEENGYEDIIVFSGDSYDSALIGVSSDRRAVYSFNKMVKWLMEKDGMSEEDAVDWIEYNVIRALPYTPAAPIVVYDLTLQEREEQPKVDACGQKGSGAVLG